MKRAIVVLILIAAVVSGVFCQTSGPMDLIVVLDTSASMSGSYKETSDYLIGPFLREFLRIGDTFHLISFSESPKLEISRRVEGVGDVETIIARFLLMYPLDPQSNLETALSFGERYSSSLPGGRSRKIVLFTDGDSPNTQNLVSEAQGRLRSQGTDLQYIQVPVTGSVSSGRPAAAQPAAAGGAQTAPTADSRAASQPASGGTGTSAAQASEQTAGGGTGSGSGTAAPSSSETAVPPAGTQAPPRPIQETPPASVPAPATSQSASQSREPETGRASDPAQPGTAPQEGGGIAVTPPPAAEQPTSPLPAIQSPPPGSQAAQPPVSSGQGQTAESGGGSSILDSIMGLPPWLFILLALLALLVLFLIIFFAARRLHNSPNEAMARAAGAVDSKDAELMSKYAEVQRTQTRPPLEQQAQQRKPLPKDTVYNEAAYENNGPMMLNLFVADQNTAIGRRNIHSVKSGYTFSVGGGKSDFLIFLVPFPPHIADVHYDGKNCTFIPRRPQYFPDIGSQQVPNCIGKTIRVISDKDYELHLRVERYEDPLKALNRMLNSISVPGPAA